MSRINKIGQHIRLPDGREATTVYNGLDGVGIKWGIHYPSMDDFTNDPMFGKPPDDFKWFPEAMLRDKGLEQLLEMECVGEDYTFLEQSND